MKTAEEFLNEVKYSDGQWVVSLTNSKHYASLVSEEKDRRIRELEEAQKWISVKDLLPNFGENVLWFTVVKWQDKERKVRVFMDKLSSENQTLEYGESAYSLANNSDYLAYDGDYYDEIATHWKKIEFPVSALKPS